MRKLLLLDCLYLHCWSVYDYQCESHQKLNIAYLNHSVLVLCHQAQNSYYSSCEKSYVSKNTASGFEGRRKRENEGEREIVVKER